MLKLHWFLAVNKFHSWYYQMRSSGMYTNKNIQCRNLSAGQPFVFKKSSVSVVRQGYAGVHPAGLSCFSWRRGKGRRNLLAMREKWTRWASSPCVNCLSFVAAILLTMAVDCIYVTVQQVVQFDHGKWKHKF